MPEVLSWPSRPGIRGRGTQSRHALAAWRIQCAAPQRSGVQNEAAQSATPSYLIELGRIHLFYSRFSGQKPIESGEPERVVTIRTIVAIGTGRSRSEGVVMRLTLFVIASIVALSGCTTTQERLTANNQIAVEPHIYNQMVLDNLANIMERRLPLCPTLPHLTPGFPRWPIAEASGDSGCFQLKAWSSSCIIREVGKWGRYRLAAPFSQTGR